MEQNKTRRKRVANFTADEKALLVQLIKKTPIIESKLTDGKTISKKKVAWISVTNEFNSNAHVYKRDLITLRRAWDNLKAIARKSGATERGYLSKTDGGPSNPPPSPQQEPIISIKQEAVPVVCEVEYTYDSDATVLSSTGNKNNDEEIVNFKDSDINKNCSVVSDVALEDTQNQNIQYGRDFFSRENTVSEDISELCNNVQTERLHYIEQPESKKQQRKASDYVRREGVLRIKHFEVKKKIEMQILKEKLETQEIKKRAAEMEEEKNKTLLEMAKLELAELKKRLDLQLSCM